MLIVCKRIMPTKQLTLGKYNALNGDIHVFSVFTVVVRWQEGVRPERISHANNFVKSCLQDSA